MQNELDSVSSPAAFVAGTIARVKTDSACRAALRRADRPATASYAWEYLVTSCRLDRSEERLAFALVGAAIARAMPEGDGVLNIGAALRSCCSGSGEDGEKTELARLRRLLACDTVSELTAILSRIVRYLQSKGAPLSYLQLLNDMLFWSEKVRIRWTQSFFRSAVSEANAEKGTSSHVSDQTAD